MSVKLKVTGFLEHYLFRFLWRFWGSKDTNAPDWLFEIWAYLFIKKGDLKRV